LRPPQSFTTQITSLFRAYRFELDNVVPATDNVDILLQVSTDGGSTWKATNYLDQVNSVSNNTVGGRAQLTTSIPLNGAAMSNTTALGGLSGTVTVINPAGTSHNKMILLQTTCVRQGGTLIEANNGSGQYTGSQAAVDAIRFIASSGNLASGKITMYGVKDS